MTSEDDIIQQAAIVAHQIKSPVSTLRTMVRTLLGGFAGELSEDQRKVLEAADRKSAEAMETIRALLSLSEARQQMPTQETCDLVLCAQQACERYRDEAKEKNLDLNCTYAAEQAAVSMSKDNVTEALTALLDNAVKYTPEGGQILLQVWTDSETERACATVSDSGIGVPEKERDKLFRPFFRASNAREVIQSGTGLGLPFVRTIAENAGGHVKVDESEFGGAKFSLVFPRVCPLSSADKGKTEQQAEPSCRVVVIGGVAAGPKVAAKIKRLDPKADVTIVEKGQVLSYAGCGLPYYISGVVENQRELISTPEGVVRGPDYFERVKSVHVMNRTEALKIDRDKCQVLVEDMISGDKHWLPYDKLALCTGAVPIVPTIPGVQLDNVYTLHGLEHAEGIKEDLAEQQAKDIFIVGGGLIGVEMAESLVSAGSRVTLVEMLPQLLPNILDPEMAELLRRHFETKGVRVMLNTRVTGFEGNGRIRRVVTDERAYPADMAIMGVGVRPNVKLASDSGLDLGETGAIKVDDHMRTSDSAIFAAGDCVEAHDLINDEPAYVPLGSTANKQGRVAAINICGGEESFPGITGTTVCKVFDYTVARAGLTEKEARDQGHDLVIAITPGLDRAHFMPHAAMIITKLIVDYKSKELIGIQVVGPGEAAKRVDVAVAAMTGKLDIDSISKLDLCYAPSYSEALDNLHTACNVAKNKLEGYMAGISACKVKEKLARGEDIMLLDVRSHGELNEASIDGSTHIPLAALRGRLGELPREKEIIVFSGVSLSAYEAAIILQANGFENVKVMDGGIIMWPHCTNEP